MSVEASLYVKINVSDFYSGIKILIFYFIHSFSRSFRDSFIYLIYHLLLLFFIRLLICIFHYPLFVWIMHKYHNYSNLSFIANNWGSWGRGGGRFMWAFSIGETACYKHTDLYLLHIVSDFPYDHTLFLFLL